MSNSTTKNPQSFRPLADRFWEKVQKTNSCWLWTGCTNSNGYGQIWVTSTIGRQLAPRVSWELRYGTIPEGMNVLHNCPGGDNPACVNPAHLWLGTQRENVHDMVIKGRMNHANRVKGESVHTARLTVDQVKEIRLLRKQGMTQRAVAKQFGVDQAAISAITLRKSWKHIE